MTLAEATRKVPVIVRRVGGERAFRRRLMELGLVPGTEVVVEKVAPLGDPLELSLRGCRLSIRRAEAGAVDVEPIRACDDAADELLLAAE
ncbi:MAG: ferrous iron transport protein A [Myxococcales bacterium]|nr:ferrous iron transport protein A [Myxococcales bacterium]